MLWCRHGVKGHTTDPTAHGGVSPSLSHVVDIASIQGHCGEGWLGQELTTWLSFPPSTANLGQLCSGLAQKRMSKDKGTHVCVQIILRGGAWSQVAECVLSTGSTSRAIKATTTRINNKEEEAVMVVVRTELLLQVRGPGCGVQLDAVLQLLSTPALSDYHTFSSTRSHKMFFICLSAKSFNLNFGNSLNV